MAARKAARQTRTADEFSVASLAAALAPPKDATSGVFTWTLEQIRQARDLQMQGQFRLPARMAAAMRTDDALFTAHENRMDPQRVIGVEMVPSKRGRTSSAERIADEADALYGAEGVGVTSDTLADVHSELANHGVAIGYNVPRVRDDGSRVDLTMCHWPLESVRWDPIAQQLVTRVAPMPGTNQPLNVPIVHGDGRWVVFQKHSTAPWQHEACVLPAALIWARHAQAVSDWMAGSAAHGNVKVVGTPPEGMPLTNQDGTPSREALEMLALMRALVQRGNPFGLKPFGSDVDMIANASRAWQVWLELVTNAQKAAARIYLGTDGTLGAQGGAPGVDIQALFGVATTKVQGDLWCIERGLKTGLLDPWCAINFGDSSLAPTRRYMIPDPDAEAVMASVGERWTTFTAAISQLRSAGFVIDQILADRIAESLGLESPTIDESKPAQPKTAPNEDMDEERAEDDGPAGAVLNLRSSRR